MTLIFLQFYIKTLPFPRCFYSSVLFYISGDGRKGIDPAVTKLFASSIRKNLSTAGRGSLSFDKLRTYSAGSIPYANKAVCSLHLHQKNKSALIRR